jgi:hypothetical protein
VIPMKLILMYALIDIYRTELLLSISHNLVLQLPDGCCPLFSPRHISAQSGQGRH